MLTGLKNVGYYLVGLPLYYLFVAPFLAMRHIYKEYWLPFLFKFNKTKIMGGRAHAGRMSRYSQIARLIGNAITIAAILIAVAVIGVTIVYSGGLAAPVWAATMPYWLGGLMALGMGINFLALPVGSSAKTVKIQTYYDAEWELQLLNNEKATIKQEPPHGMNSPPAQQAMLLTRYGHDINGAAGTAASWAGTIVDILVMASIIVNPVVGSILFLASRVSALVSATGAPLTNQQRLSVHKKNISDQIVAYYDLCQLKTNDIHQRIKPIVDRVLFELRLNLKDHYTQWVSFRCYRAMERLLQSKGTQEITDEQLISNVISFLSPLCEQKYSVVETMKSMMSSEPIVTSQQQFNRSKLRGILSDGPELSVLDAMPHIEEKLYQHLREQIIPAVIPVAPTINLLKEKLHPDADAYSALFLHYFHSAVLEKNCGIPAGFDWNTVLQRPALADCFIHDRDSDRWSIYVDGLKAKWVVETAHGPQLVAPFQLKKLAELFLEELTQALPLEAQPQQVTAAPPEEEPPQYAEVQQPAPDKNNKEIARQKALDIWYRVIKEVDDEADEGKYDDHDPLFHGVMTFCIDYLMEKLEHELDQDPDDHQIKLVEFELEAKLRKEIQRSTYISTKSLLIYNTIKPVGYKYFNPDKLNQPTYECQTEWLRQGSSVRHTLRAS